jgi:hypothetical protein
MLCCTPLPCRHVLPSRALLLIREYSRPSTRPDWRNSKPIITIYSLYLDLYIEQHVQRRRIRRLRLINKIIKNIENTEWYWTYNTIRFNGLTHYYTLYFQKYGVKYDTSMNVRDMEGINFAINFYLSMLAHKCTFNLIKNQ